MSDTETPKKVRVCVYHESMEASPGANTCESVRFDSYYHHPIDCQFRWFYLPARRKP